MSDWTPEPLEFDIDDMCIRSSNGLIARIYDCEDFLCVGIRLEACYNACAGIPDPADAIRQAREALSELIARKEEAHGEGYPGSDGRYDRARKALAALGGGE